MSSTAPSSPAIVRNSPSSRHGDRPLRTHSTATRPSTSSTATPHRSLSQSHSHTHSNSASHHPNLTNVARRDFEQTNIAQQPAQRASSRERTTAPGRNDSTRSSHNTGSRHGHARYASDVSATTNGISGAGSSSRTQGQTSRGRRTTIEAATGVWALGKTIGAGSMGKVKLAKNVETGEQVAVKIVPRQSTDEHKTQQDRERADHSKEVRTAREAAIVSLVHHPYICGMRDVVRTANHWYMLFEYVNGGQMLDYIISHGRLKEKQARKFGRQIASALDYCHRNSIVHRDLKIENILISKTGDIKIIDFGLSNLFSPKSHLKTFCGSLYFAAPELLQAKQYTGPEVDIWSFGIVLYVLVCGKVPFDDQSMPQLHAKIKKGYVEYPPWLSAECKNLISRMLVTDPRQRASLSEILNHPWITKGFNAPPENYLPQREPLQLPLDPDVVKGMQGFDFGTTEYINTQLTSLLDSDDYHRAVRSAAQKNQVQTPETERKRGVFDTVFYKRRNSTTSRDTLTNPSAEALSVGSDPVNAFSPLISVYYLQKEKLERDQQEVNPGALGLPTSPGEKPLRIPDLVPPEAAYTNHASYEMPGEKPTGGRSRPRARTHGEDEVQQAMQDLALKTSAGPASPAIVTPPSEQPQVKKSSTAGALLRRFSTRKHREPDREKSHGPPRVSVSGPPESSSTPRKSFSVRRVRDKEAPSTSTLPPTESQQQHELLAPNSTGGNTAGSATKRIRALGRSASVNSTDLRRRLSRRGVSATEPRPTSESDKSSISEKRTAGDAASEETHNEAARPRGPAMRAKSLGHARRESIQARRARRDVTRDSHVPEETDQELAEEEAVDGSRSPEIMKPVYLKGLFSVSTTSNKPLPVIRADIIRVLKEIGVQYSEIRGGFSCRHAPSIDLNKVVDPPSQLNARDTKEKRRISFGFMPSDRDKDDFRDLHKAPNTPRSSRHRSGQLDQSYTNSEASDESVGRDDHKRSRARAAGETTTHVQSDLGGSMILRFEIVLVKVPLLSLHGIQFKKVDGGTWQYKNMAQKILDELRL
ncbi:protein kinase kin1 [Pseudovirgaria hyperparasitica]|uniref:non-specific serine/threonine protein kinase n=1 Tax=Pseudovirgaria hyperparasitica TaxID=470096 RepID=A0A6A6WG34_9PEZI|nr:protein kinase kin1 [Pseudovirgaria hyperparasitica]KAF2761723.1 protein kinase kin1 [Pseudovirgaria hyperparasitica]